MCNQAPLHSLSQCFAPLDDPRIERHKRHPLINILTIATCAVTSGADNWVEIAEFANAKIEWLRGFLELPNGIPSHDTFGNVFARLRPKQFKEWFLTWVRSVFEVTGGQVIAINGKRLRRSHDQSRGKAAIHRVSAWACEGQWTGLRSICAVESERHIGDEITKEVRHFIGSIAPDPKLWAYATRSHWGSTTICTGGSMSFSEKTTAEFERVTPMKTSPSYDTSLRICSPENNPSNAGPRPNAAALVGMTRTASKSLPAEVFICDCPACASALRASALSSAISTTRFFPPHPKLRRRLAPRNRSP